MRKKKKIRVSVIEFGNRPNYQMQYRDPKNNDRKVTRSTGISRHHGTKREQKAARGEAERMARDWERDLQAGLEEQDDIPWLAFRADYTEQHAESLAIKSANKIDTMFNSIERILAPELLSDVDTNAIAKYATALRRELKAEDTIASYLGTLRGALSWAKRQKLIDDVPNIDKPKRAKGAKAMKGRPLAGEEFDRMLAKTGDVVGEKNATAWRYVLNGLWWSGLRLGEAVELRWDGDGIIVDLTYEPSRGTFPKFWIPAEFEKGHTDRDTPMAPEFAQLLAETPADERTGFVFDFPRVPTRRVDTISKLISRIGKAAGVKVATNKLKGTTKFASAHDLRRSFGFRLAGQPNMTPPLLMEFMRHSNISTTMKYYVGKNADRAASAAWSSFDGKQMPKPAEAANSEYDPNPNYKTT